MVFNSEPQPVVLTKANVSEKTLQVRDKNHTCKEQCTKISIRNNATLEIL